MLGHLQSFLIYNQTCEYRCRCGINFIASSRGVSTEIAPMASTKIAIYIYDLLIISPGIHGYVYYIVFAKLLQENYLKNLF